MESFIPDLPPLRPDQHSAKVKKAACLALVMKNKKKEWQVLLGQRNSSAKFMPKKYVLPGGKIDYQDRYLIKNKYYSGQASFMTQNILNKYMSYEKMHLNLLTAIRETYEETGYALTNPKTLNPELALILSDLNQQDQYEYQTWKNFLKQKNNLPSLSSLQVFARALTPPNPVRRYDTWYFFSDITNQKNEIPSFLPKSEELENINFYPFRLAYRLNLPAVVYFILQTLENKLLSKSLFYTKIPFAYYKQNKMLVYNIGKTF